MTARTSITPWRRYRTDAARWFSPEEVAKGRAYSRPLGYMSGFRGAIALAVTLAFVHGKAAGDVIDAVGVDGWVLELVAVVVALELIALIFAPWFSGWRVFRHDREWGLSTQGWRGWVSDQVKDLLLSTAITLVLAIPLYAIIRAGDSWWVFGWLLFTGFGILFGFLFPVVFAPIFNKFEPLEDDEIAPRVRAVAERAGLRLQGVYVADASVRSRATNAYVAGLGKTRRVVLYDTILEWPPELLEQVVAHELGHWKHGHLARQIPAMAVMQLVAFYLLSRVMETQTVLDWAGVAEVGDPRTYPLLFLLYPAILGASGLAMAWVGRVFERQADLHALEVLDDPTAFQATFRRLADDNKADVDPPWWKWVRQVHPPVPERMAMAEAWGASEPPADGP